MPVSPLPGTGPRIDVHELEKIRQEMLAAPISLDAPTPMSFRAARPVNEVAELRAELEEAHERIDRLSAELFACLRERKARDENMTSAMNRSSELLERVREGRRIVNAYVAKCRESQVLLAKTESFDSPEWKANVDESKHCFEALGEWATRDV
jgi:chromosome segregation ATPase